MTTRSGLPQHLGLAALAAGTTWAALWSWRGLTERGAEYLIPLLLLGVVVAGTGAGLRWLRVPGVAVLLVQVVLAGLWVLWTTTGSMLPGSIDALAQATRTAWLSAGEYAAPVPREAPPVTPLLMMGGAGCLVAVDFLAGSLRRASLAGLPLLTVYSVPGSITGVGTPWWVFAVSAAGFLGMLFLQHDEQVTRWGRGMDRDHSGFGVRTGAARGTALSLGALATVVAVFLPTVLPTMSVAFFEGNGPGAGGQVTVENPMVDLRRDLTRGRDADLVEITTNQPNPQYLRIATLNRLSANEWSTGDREIPDSQAATGQMPDLAGVASSVTRRDFSYDVSVTEEFTSTWLPTTQHISRINAPGAWRYDLSTMDFVAREEGLDTAGLDYAFTAVDVEIDPAVLDRATSGASQAGTEYLEVPSTLPGTVRSLANAVTGDASTRFRKAVALQDWLRNSGGFEYDDRADPGNGGDEMAEFLAERVGYCEQFAAVMATMSRLVGIPARVAVGFLTPERTGPRSYVYSSHDMHAWAELYFPGQGWVLFDATPAARVPDVPAYQSATDLPEIPEAPSASGPSRAEEQLPERAEDDPAAAAGDDASTFPWRGLLGGVGVVLVLVLLAWLPRLVREARRRARLREGSAEAAWRELRDGVLDLGHHYPDGRSPRETARSIGALFATPGGDVERPVRGRGRAPEADAALEHLVRTLELQRYGRPEAADGTSSDWTPVLEVCGAALAAGVTPGARRRAVWWPASLVRLRSRGPASADHVSVGVPTFSAAGVVDHAS